MTKLSNVIDKKRKKIANFTLQKSGKIVDEVGKIMSK